MGKRPAVSDADGIMGDSKSETDAIYMLASAFKFILVSRTVTDKNIILPKS